MLIVCPSCATSYQIRPESLGEVGRQVRCVHCHTVWFEAPREPEMAEAATDQAFANPAFIRPPLDDVVDMSAVAPDPAFGTAAAAADFGPPADFPNKASAQPYAAAPEEAPSIVPSDRPEGRKPSVTERAIETLAARRARRGSATRREARKLGLPAAICALVLVIACLVAARQQVVRFMPQTARLYAAVGLPVNLRSLIFENIKTVRETHDGVPILIVEGDIVGTTSRPTEVPRLRFAVLDARGKEIYAWTAKPARSLLPAGESLSFKSRLASPPAESSGVSVRFFNRHDAQAGLL